MMTAKTQYDYAHLLDLRRVAAKTVEKKETMIRRAMVLVLALICAGVGVAVITGQNGTAGQGAIYFLLGAILLGVFVLYDHFSAWRIKQKTRRNQVPDQFTFGPYGVDITRGEQSVHYQYSDCDILYETELALYLFHHRGKGLVISKGQIQGGTPEELRSWLEGQCQIKAQWMGRSLKQV